MGWGNHSNCVGIYFFLHLSLCLFVILCVCAKICFCVYKLLLFFRVNLSVCFWWCYYLVWDIILNYFCLIWMPFSLTFESFVSWIMLTDLQYWLGLFVGNSQISTVCIQRRKFPPLPLPLLLPLPLPPLPVHHLYHIPHYFLCRKLVIPGLLTIYGEESLAMSRMVGTNSQAESLYRREIHAFFVDLWDQSSSDRSPYDKDGFHLNSIGKARLGRNLNENIRRMCIRKYMLRVICSR